MVLPDASAERPSFYEAGRGHVLEHFAGMATPDARGQQNGGSNRATGARNVAVVGGEWAPSRAGDRSSTGGNSGGFNRNDSAEGELSRREKLQQWKRAKGPCGAANVSSRTTSSRSKLGGAQPTGAKQPAARSGGRGNQVYEDFTVVGQASDGVSSTNRVAAAASQSYAMSSSPPHHSTSPVGKSSGSAASRNHLWKASATSLGASAVSKEVSASVDFLMSRDREEEDRAVESKSDREKAYLFKKRYADTYVHAVALLKQMAALEQTGADRDAHLDVLKSQVETQSRIIDTMSDNQQMSDPTDHQQEKKLQALCREVGALVHQLNERDSMINSLNEERDHSVKVINELRLSQRTCESGNCGSQGFDCSSGSMNEDMRSTDGLRELERKLALAEREKQQAQDREAGLTAKLTEMQELHQISEAQRSALSNGLDQAEEQIAALHTQWVQEKKDLLASVTTDDNKSRGLAEECDRLRKDNDSVRASYRVLSQNENKYSSILETQRRAADEAQTYITQLESELKDVRSRLANLAERENKINALENDLTGMKEKLRNQLMKADELEERLEQKDEEFQGTKARFQERTRLLERRVFDAEIVRRSLHNKVMELKGNIRVFCRVRPVLRHELAVAGNEEVFAFPDYRSERRQIELHANPKSHTGYGQNGFRSVVKKYNFDFDLVFDGGCSQEEVFLEVSALVQSALDGYSVCIFAYGQTGSGKTYTMQGREEVAGFQNMEPSEDMGIVGRAISHIFAGIDDLRSSGWSFIASLEMVEIYNETLRDLMAPVGSAGKVGLRLDSDGKATVTNSCVLGVENEHEAWQLLQKALSRRSTKSTKMNDRSSRSHCIITFRLNGVNSLTRDERVGIVNLVDLAGSERLSNSGSGADKELMKEAQAINKSLSALGNVICALAKKSPHVPFRDSKLTHVLSPSLGGDSKTLMICNLSPLGQHRNETLNSLRFAKMVNSCEIAYPSISSKA